MTNCRCPTIDQMIRDRKFGFRNVLTRINSSCSKKILGHKGEVTRNEVCIISRIDMCRYWISLFINLRTGKPVLFLERATWIEQVSILFIFVCEKFFSIDLFVRLILLHYNITNNNLRGRRHSYWSRADIKNVIKYICKNKRIWINRD